MDILESKSLITNEINTIFSLYQTQIQTTIQKEKEWAKEKEVLNQTNHRLIEEVSEKDKLLSMNDKKLLDYEVMINKIQDEALKEMDEKTKHDMLRAQDKEIFNRDEEIKRLQRRIDTLESEKKLLSQSVVEVVEDVEELKDEIKKDKTLVERMKEVEKENENEEEKEKEEEKEEEKEKEKESSETTEDLTDSEEGYDVETIKYYGKEYFIVEGEKPIQYIYAIEDGELGEKKGEMKGGKKHMYKNK